MENNDRRIKVHFLLRLLRVGTWLLLIAGIALGALIHMAIAASAAENSALATPHVATETSTALCPTEFNIDDSAWAMHWIDGPRVKELAEHVVAMEHTRVFSYFPDAEKRIFVGIKNLENPDCVAKLYSYGLPSGVDGKRVMGIIKSREKLTAFLLTDKGWESGDNLEIFTPDCKANECNLVFVLYRNEVVVASRTLLIKQVPLSDWIYKRVDGLNREPVE